MCDTAPHCGWQAATAPTDEDPAPLSEEEVAEKEKLLDTGFSNWNRRDFSAFVRACEKYGRGALDMVSRLFGIRRLSCLCHDMHIAGALGALIAQLQPGWPVLVLQVLPLHSCCTARAMCHCIF